MKSGIKVETIEHINKYIYLLELDVENGAVLNRTASPQKRGYYAFRLKNRLVKLHHVIAIAGGLPVEVGKEINHIDGDKANNRLDNLEVTTRSENVKHAYDSKLAVREKGSKVAWSILNEEQVKQVKTLLKEGKGLTEIGNMFGVSKHYIADIKRGRTWKHI